MTGEALTADLVQRRLDAALGLVSDGFELVEMLEGHKEPLGREWQKLGMTEPEAIRRVLGRRSPARQFGVLPPAGSGLLVIDFDTRAAFEELEPLLPPTLTVLTSLKDPASGWRGRHVYLRLPEHVDEATVPRTFAGGEVRVAGSGQVVGPWGRHPSGTLYEPANGTLTVGQATPQLIEALRSSQRARKSAQRAARGPEDAGWKVTEPGRHDFLLSRGRKLRGDGLSGPRLLEELRRLNRERCEPPKTDAEVVSIVAWIENNIGDDPPGVPLAGVGPRRTAPRSIADAIPAGRPPSPPPPAEASVQRTDLGNARRFAAEHGGDFRFVVARRGWLAWDGTRWAPDADAAVWRAAKATADRLLGDALAVTEPDERRSALRHALASQGEPALRRMLALAESEVPIALRPEDLDADPWLLTVGNGTLDLRSGELRAHNPADLISLGSRVDYDPEAACPRFERFLGEIFAGDEELEAFVQRAIGYSLTGETGERVVFICHGTGFNGKSTLLEDVVRPLLGTLAEAASFDVFTRMKRGDGPRNDIARLHRARLVTAVESAEGRRLDEAVVKHLTGGDTVAARFLYGEFFEFRPRFKLWLATNHRPRVDGGDDAIWDRIRLIPFAVSFRDRPDPGLKAALRAELPGILAWAVRGCLAWQREGLGHAGAVTRATSAYRTDEDVLGAFLAERCAIELGAHVTAGALRAAFDTFCTELGERPMAASTLGKQLVDRGFRRDKVNEQRVYLGLRVLNPDRTDSPDTSSGNFPLRARARGVTESNVRAVRPVRMDSVEGRYDASFDEMLDPVVEP